MDIERKTFELSQAEFKAGREGQGRISGYAATFGNIDAVGDVIMPGAFQKSLEAFKRDGFIALGHDHTGLPAATLDVVKEDEHGLWVEADFHSVPPAQHARTVAQERIARGKSVSFSIGYQVPMGGAEYRADGARLLKEIDVREVSIVNIPANPQALVANVKDATATEATFDERIEALATEADIVVTIARKHQALRVKEGRAISERRRKQLMELRDVLDALLVETEPPAKEAAQEGEAQEPKSLSEADLYRIRQQMTDTRYKAALVGLRLN